MKKGKVLRIACFGEKIDQTRAPKNFRSCRWGDERTVKRALTGSEDPHRREQKF